MAKVLTITESGKELIDLIVAQGGEKRTAKDYAALRGEEKANKVNGIATGLQRKGLLVREEAEVEVDGKATTVKFLVLTDLAINGEYEVK